MPDLRALLVSMSVGFGIAAYAVLWWRWPLAVGAVLGIVFGGIALVGTLSLGVDPKAADAAWREAAADLQEPIAKPLDVPVRRPSDGPVATDVGSSDDGQSDRA